MELQHSAWPRASELHHSFQRLHQGWIAFDNWFWPQVSCPCFLLKPRPAAWHQITCLVVLCKGFVLRCCEAQDPRNLFVCWSLDWMPVRLHFHMASRGSFNLHNFTSSCPVLPASFQVRWVSACPRSYGFPSDAGMQLRPQRLQPSPVDTNVLALSDPMADWLAAASGPILGHPNSTMALDPAAGSCTLPWQKKVCHGMPIDAGLLALHP